MTALTITATVTDASGASGTGSVAVEVVAAPMSREEFLQAAMTPSHLAPVRQRVIRAPLPDHAERSRQIWSQVR